tara:strand:+ start:5175 stop:5876 length:702 start_codon:yes stop_codon:yes gene_type:complete
MKNKIKNIIENQDSKIGYLFDIVIQFFIILSIIAFSIETLPDLTPQFISYLNIIELIIIYVFTAEYLLRFYVADKKVKYIFSFYGLVDLIAILPFYVFTNIDLRSIRIVRLLRLIKLFRFNKSMITLKAALSKIKNELILFSFITFILLYISSIGIYFFENSAQPENFKSIFHCLWWAVCTLTTVGYGDIYPITTGGKIFTGIVTLIGVGIIAIPTGLIASSFISALKENELE